MTNNELKSAMAASGTNPQSAIRTAFAVALGYVALVLLFTWPAPLHLATQVARAEGSDFYLNIWNLWWMRFSLLDLHQNPYATSYLNYPTGLPLTYHILDPVDGLISIPFQWLFGLVTTYNLLRLAHLLFTPLATYALCRVLRLPRMASWIAGALFAFSPRISGTFDLGALIEINAGWMPLYILMLIKGVGNRSLGLRPGHWGWLVGAGLALTGAALATWYFLVNLLIFTALYLVWEMVGIWRERSREARAGVRDQESGVRSQESEADNDEGRNPLRSEGTRIRNTPFEALARVAAIVACAALLLSPLLVAAARESVSDEGFTTPPLDTVIRNSADITAFFQPAPARFHDMSTNRLRISAALGWTPLALAALGLITARAAMRRREKGDPHPSPRHVRPYLWLASALVFTILAMGPHLLVGNSDTGVPMPYLLLSKLPLLGAGRTPVVFGYMTSLSLAVMSAYGIASLMRSMPERGRYARQSALYAVLVGLVIFEFFNIPRTMTPISVHPFFETIRASGGEAVAHDAVLELPASTRTEPAMLNQTTHQHPIIGGYTSRRYPYPWRDTTPGVAQLVRSDAAPLSDPDILTPPIGETALAALDYYGVRYIAIFKDGDAGLVERAEQAADTLFSSHNIVPLIQDLTLTVYKVPPQTRDSPIAGLGSGWYGVEGSSGSPRRWTDGHAWVQLTNPTASLMPTRVTLAAYAVSHPRTMLITLDGRELTRKEMNPYPSQQVTLDLDLTAGEHWLELTSVQPPEIPPGDSRSLSIGFEKVAVEKR